MLFKFYLELIARLFIGKVIIDNSHQALMYGRAYFFFQVQFWAISSKALLGSPLPVVVSYITATNYCQLYCRSLNCQAVPLAWHWTGPGHFPAQQPALFEYEALLCFPSFLSSSRAENICLQNSVALPSLLQRVSHCRQSLLTSSW